MDKDALRLTIVRLDDTVKDIHRIWKSAPSGYQHPKAYLAMSRAYLRSDPKKALKHADKARALFLKESVLATRYNSMSGGLRTSNESLRNLNKEYLRRVSDGDYDKADAVLKKMVSMTGSMPASGTDLSVEKWASDEKGTVIMVKNSGDYVITVNRLVVTAGSDIVRTEPKGTFSVQPRSGREIKVDSTSEVKVSVQYTERGTIKGIEKTL